MRELAAASPQLGARARSGGTGCAARRPGSLCCPFCARPRRAPALRAAPRAPSDAQGVADERAAPRSIRLARRAPAPALPRGHDPHSAKCVPRGQGRRRRGRAGDRTGGAAGQAWAEPVVGPRRHRRRACAPAAAEGPGRCAFAPFGRARGSITLGWSLWVSNHLS